MIQLASSTSKIKQCFPIMSQLRPHLNLENFIEQVQQQIKSGYQLVYITENNVIIGLAGFN